MSVVVWFMVGLAFWHFAVLVPDRFAGGIVGALLAAVAGALLSGYLLPTPGVSGGATPGMLHVLWATPGSLAGLALSYWAGARRASGP
jgi:hypothetical protein